VAAKPVGEDSEHFADPAAVRHDQNSDFVAGGSLVSGPRDQRLKIVYKIVYYIYKNNIGIYSI
jgi:hypothetical protein